MGVNGIYGLSGSGIDVESLVKAGMLTKQNEYNKMDQNSTKDSWIKSAYTDIYSSMTTFKYTTLSNYKMSSTMNAMQAASSNTAAVTATANGAAAPMSHQVQVETMSSNAYLLSASAISRENKVASSSIYLKDNVFASISGVSTYTIGNTTYTSDQVQAQKDTNGNVTGYKVLSNSSNPSDSNIGSVFAANNVNIQTTQYKIQQDIATYAASGVSITYGGHTYTGSQISVASDGNYSLNGTEVTNNDNMSFNVGDGNTYSGLSNMAIGKDSSGNFTFTTLTNATTVQADAKAISFQVFDQTGGTYTSTELSKRTVSYTYADLANGKTYNDLASDIKSTGTNVQATYDAANDSFSIYNNNGGSANTVTLTMAAATDGGTAAAKLFNNLNLQQSSNGALTAITSFAAGSTNSVAGVNGTVKIDGREYTGITNNKITVSGVTYNLLSPTATGTTATVSVSQNTSAIVASVKQFVDDYNKMLDSLNDKLNETSYSDYQPLTKDQQSSMTQTQIDQWNTKAKSGLLKNSTILRNAVQEMRQAIYTPVNSVNSQYNSASAIGISSSTDQGHLTLDTDKLSTALAADPDCVYQIFASDQDNYYYTSANKQSSTIQQDDYNNRGIANRLYFNAITDSMKDISDYAGTSADTDDQSSLGKMITNLQTKMSTFKTQMNAYENTLYNKYDAMEVAISRLNAQLGTVTGAK
jgi:flagellar capping protein FliD